MMRFVILFYNTVEECNNIPVFECFDDYSDRLLGDGASFGQGINDSGEVAGSFYNSSAGYSHAFLYDSTGMHDLGALGGTDSRGFAINNSGEVTGNTLYNHAFLYDSTGMHDLGALWALGTSAGLGINNGGEVTGWATTSGNAHVHAFLYDSAGMHDLGTLGGTTDSVGEAINASGEITGYAYTTAFPGGPLTASYAFLYDGSGMHDLGALGGGTDSFGYGINDNGEVVGGSNGEAFLYDGGTMYDLNSLVLGGHVGLYNATAINDAGQIVANGCGGAYDGCNAYLLTPVASSLSVPEPVPLMSLSASLLGFAILRRQRSLTKLRCPRA